MSHSSQKFTDDFILNQLITDKQEWSDIYVDSMTS